MSVAQGQRGMALEFPLTRVPRMKPGERVRYVPNHRSFGAFMKSAQMRDVTEEVAGDIATAAGAQTPSGGGPESRGMHARVKGGFRVKRNAGLVKVGGNLRVRVDVVNDEEGAALVEFGGRNVVRRRMLGRAASRYGDFKPEGGPE